MLILGVSCLQAPCWAPTSLPLPTVPSAQIPQLVSSLHTHKKNCIVFPDKDHHIMNLEQPSRDNAYRKISQVVPIAQMLLNFFESFRSQEGSSGLPVWQERERER